MVTLASCIWMSGLSVKKSIQNIHNMKLEELVVQQLPVEDILLEGYFYMDIKNKLFYQDWIVEIMKFDLFHFTAEQMGAQIMKCLL